MTDGEWKTKKDRTSVVDAVRVGIERKEIASGEKQKAEKGDGAKDTNHGGKCLDGKYDPPVNRQL